MSAAPALEALGGDLELDGLLAVFYAETGDNLTALEQSLLALESAGHADPEILQAMLRAAHTVKGNSAIVGYEDVAGVAHTLEDELEHLRDGSVPFSPSIVTGLLDSVDRMRALLRAGDTQQQTQQPNEPRAVRATLRVDTTRLDTLLDLTGEITIARGRLGQLLADSATETLGATLWQLEQLHAALQGEVMALRMVPLGPLFEAQRRTVRDTAARLGKQARLVIEGHDVEVDTSIAEQMRDPFTHMMRNAIDHGMESPDVRVAAGKPAMGTVRLRAMHHAGAVVIELEDDGRGLDRAKIAERAQRLGLVADASLLSDEQVFALIFEPGFTTAAEVTSVSGRGVGMDVVRRQVQALRGTIDIASTPGTGTRFTIRLPLTVAIIAGFTVRVDCERYVLPLDTVEEVVDFDARIAASSSEGILDLRGSAVPWLRLRDVLGLDAGPVMMRASAVVVHHGEHRLALVVDQLEGDCQAVIKPLAEGLPALPGIAGSTILGDGRVAFILSVAELIARRTAIGRGA